MNFRGESMTAVTDTFSTALKDSGSRADYSTGAVRDNSTGKGRLDLLPAEAIVEVARHFEKGANKYAARNWEKGIPYSRYVDSLLRHTFQFLAGHRDEPHLISAAWNALCLIQTIKWVDQGVLPQSLNDLPVYTSPITSPATPAEQAKFFSKGNTLTFRAFEQVKGKKTNPNLNYVLFMRDANDEDVEWDSVFVFNDGRTLRNDNHRIFVYENTDEWKEITK
jgi:phage terminase large subunit-like protein